MNLSRINCSFDVAVEKCVLLYACALINERRDDDEKIKQKCKWRWQLLIWKMKKKKKQQRERERVIHTQTHTQEIAIYFKLEIMNIDFEVNRFRFKMNVKIVCTFKTWFVTLISVLVYCSVFSFFSVSNVGVLRRHLRFYLFF